MKKILTLFLALTVLAGCSKDESPTPAPAEPAGGAISLRSEGALETEPADCRRTGADLHLRGVDTGRQSPLRAA